MRSRDATWWLCCALILAAAGVREVAAQDASAAPAPFELRDGDRVVFVGGTFVEREGQFGHIETALTTSYPERSITFRNLGWSGDTVWAESRGIFDPPAAGYKRMIELIQEQKPTVIMLAYGQNESFAGEAGLEAFVKQYEKLCDDLAPTKARLVFILPMLIHSPIAIEKTQRTKINDNILLYKEAIAKLAANRGGVVDLDRSLPVWSLVKDFWSGMYEGMHLTESGYTFPAAAFTETLGLPQMNIADPAVVALRKKIVEKNTLFFHRWRPANVTYLFLFRKHEQGNNAVEMSQFDPLIEAAEQEIAKLKQAVQAASQN